MMALAVASLLLAALPAVVYLQNRRLFDRAPRSPLPDRDDAGRVAVLIPARNEQRSIADTVCSVLRSKDVDFEVVVLDDQSEDRTPEILSALSQSDSRVRWIQGAPLPDEWCGKQHACWQLANATEADYLVFLDADVRLAPDALARAMNRMRTSAVDLLSGFPCQETGTFFERLLLPLIHFVLLGFLPIGRMRSSLSPAYAAGCGQFFITRRHAYLRAGGHAAIKSSLHDGITLTRAYRAAGLRTDVFDASDIATCRMYRGAIETWRGLSKNAVEGIAHPARIVPFSVVLVGGQIIPPVLLTWESCNNQTPGTMLLAGVATVLCYVPRLAATRRFGQPLLEALLQPLSVAVFLILQWHALLRHLLRRPRRWKQRSYGHASFVK